MLRAIARVLEFFILFIVQKLCSQWLSKHIFLQRQRESGFPRPDCELPGQPNLDGTVEEDEETIPILPPKREELGILTAEQERQINLRDEAISSICPPWILMILSLILASGLVFFVVNNTISNVKDFKQQLETPDYQRRTNEVINDLQEIETKLAKWFHMSTNNTAAQVVDTIKTEALNHVTDILKVMSGGIVSIILWLSFVVCLLPSAWKKNVLV